MRVKVIKRLLAAGLAVAVLLGIFVMTTSAADATVTLDVANQRFTFGNATAYTKDGHNHKYVDLFGDSMKNLMPGDSASTEITVAVSSLGNNQRADLYLQAYIPSADDYNSPEPVENKLQKLLDTGCSLTVGIKQADGTTRDITTALNEDVTVGGVAQKATVPLGSVTNNGTVDLVVTFNVPNTVGNDFQAAVAEIGWIFLAEVITTGGGNNNNTGGGGRPIGDPETPLAPELNTADHYAYIIGRDDGLVHPEATITRAEVATIFFRMLTDESRASYWSQTNTYSDVSAGQWFNAAISTLSGEAGVITGYPDGTFQPNGSITRAEFATMAVRFFELNYQGDDLFTDISDHWAREFINNAASAGLVNGYPDGTFLPQQAITRAEAVTTVNRTLGRSPHADHLHADMITWPDNNPGAWYYTDMQEATNSHEYGYNTAEGSATPDEFETWTTLQQVRDWAALEREWADNNASPSPGEVISSAL